MVQRKPHVGVNPHSRFGETEWPVTEHRTSVATVGISKTLIDEQMISVLLVDDQELFREIARSMFESTGDFKVVAEAVDGIEAVNAYARYNPDFVLMDVQMARMNGIEAARHILQNDPRANVVLISMRNDPEYARAASVLGCRGFVTKRDLDVQTIKRLVGGSSVAAA